MRVFPTSVANRTRREDFTRARIALVDEGGRIADLHSLRTTLGTSLARQGVTPQVAQKILRHTDYRLTLRHDTVLGLQDTAEALQRVPRIASATSESATGTVGADPTADCQHWRQQSAHDSVLHAATTMHGPATTPMLPTPCVLRPCATPCDALRLRAMG